MTIVVFVDVSRPDSRNVLDEVRHHAARQVLIQCGGNVAKAARHLGLHRQSLVRMFARWRRAR